MFSIKIGLKIVLSNYIFFVELPTFNSLISGHHRITIKSFSPLECPLVRMLIII